MAIWYVWSLSLLELFHEASPTDMNILLTFSSEDVFIFANDIIFKSCTTSVENVMEFLRNQSLFGL